MALACVPYEAASRMCIIRKGSRLAGACDVWHYIRDELAGEMREHFVLITLDVRHRVIAKRTIAIGSLTGVEVHPREVFKPAILDSAAAVIIAHNHPSGDPSPSRQDVELTARLRAVGETHGIVLVDHVIVGDGGYQSMAERKWV